MQNNLELKVTANTRIAKFSEGQDPETSEPFEVVEEVHVFTGDEAKQLLESLGGENSGSN
jgi:hypothetical protein